MTKEQELLTEISTITREIEERDPELLKYLDETPMTIPDIKNPDVDNKALKEYLETLKEIKSKYEEGENK
ncbi:hypothetical protein SAMN03097699_2639 [Flavobacteriaceae bacterium MAR_2010_188]|nr:hypothetical protein SAMN03097699_2639 [Flavobacteriaceae bacterium MAR_2010_188]